MLWFGVFFGVVVILGFVWGRRTGFCDDLFFWLLVGGSVRGFLCGVA